MKLSLIVPPALADLPPADLATWAAAAGFDAVDAEPETGPETVAALAASGLALGPLRIRASLADSDPATRAEAVETACRGIDRAVALGLATVWTLPRNVRNDASPRDNFAAARREEADPS